MPSTYTSNGGIEKIGLGEKAGAWGTTTNTNFDIIDRLTNGVGAITLSGTTHTLTTSDGTLSDGMYKVLVLGGSPSGANQITISPNDADKLYFVKNGTSQTVTFTQGTGSDATILAGNSAIIYADGAGSGAAVTDLTSGLIVKGITTSGNIELDADGGIIKFKDNGTEIAYIQNSSSSLQIQSIVSDGDIKFRGSDGGSGIDALVLDMSEAGNATFNGTITTPGLTLGSTAITATGAELNYTDGVTSNIQTQIDSVIPSGTVLPYAGSSAPTGFLLCYGQAVSRSTYAALFTALDDGATYGTGDGSSTFNVPDLRGRVVAGQDDMGGSSGDNLTGLSGGVNGDTLGATGGSQSHTITIAEMPAHTHTVTAHENPGGTGNSNGSETGDSSYDRSSTTSSTGGGGVHNNVQPTIILNYIIKT